MLAFAWGGTSPRDHRQASPECTHGQVPKIRAEIKIRYRVPALAAFRVWREREEVASVACPMFGTGWGRVPPWVAAAQMWEAFVQAWS